MSSKVVIIEDEVLLALDIERVLEDGGYEVVGIAADRHEALVLGATADLALVDLNLRDGLTGPQTARDLAERFGTRIVYVTANPAQIKTPAPTAVGVMSKPFCDQALLDAAGYALGKVERADIPGFARLN